MNQFFKTRHETEQWLNTVSIRNYIINDDLTVDVNGRVSIDYTPLENGLLPVQFGYVKDKFSAVNVGLVSLKGMPYKIDSDCLLVNNKIKSLEFCPQHVRNMFNCNQNEISSLKYCEDLDYLSFNYNKLTNLDFCPQNSAQYSFSNNQITCTKGLPEEIIGHLDIENNPITSFKNFPKRIGQSLVCGNELILNSKGAPEFIAHDFMIKGKINFNILDIKTQCRTFTHECQEEEKISFFSHLYQKNYLNYSLKIPFSFLKKVNDKINLEIKLKLKNEKDYFLKI